MDLLFSLILYLSFSYATSAVTLAATATAIATDVPSGTIERTTKQQILATIPPNLEGNSVPFLTSPTGKYTVCFLRHQSAPIAGSYGNDFCYVQVQDAATGHSMWESECAPISTVNTCALLFSWKGLEIFDGSNLVWDTNAASADNNFLETLELVDEGDMRIRDKDGELAWKASDDPRVNQHCGLPGSPGVGPALPPFAEPIGHDKNLPFGQPQQLPQPVDVAGAGPEQVPAQSGYAAGVSQSFGFNSQPLVDNTPYDSGCSKGKYWAGGGVGLFMSFLLFIA